MILKLKNIHLLITMILVIIISLLIIILVCDNFINSYSKNKTFDKIEEIPKNKAGLVLGTIKNLEYGQINLYFKYRIDAAEKLIKANKVDYLIVSGDNSRYGYNEPKDMKEALIKRGIPENKIIEDFAGFRTLDSIVRAKEVFGQNSFTIISQEFHNKRALFIAQKNKLNCVAFNAQDVNTFKSIKVKIREYLARVKVVLDIYILRTKPKFY